MTHIIVTLDGDGQHNPIYLDNLLNPIKQGRADLVIGSRFLSNENAPKIRQLGINLITFLYNFGSKQKIKDSQSGFRAFTTEVAKQCPITEDNFAFSTEFLIKARAKGFRIMEIPISCVYRTNGQDHSMGQFKHGLQVALATIKWRWKIEFLRQEEAKPKCSKINIKGKI